jgi:hypothetical protein
MEEDAEEIEPSFSKWLKLIAITSICNLLDFSCKVCHCFSTLQLLGSTFNQKGEQYGWIIKTLFPVLEMGFLF